MTRDNSVGRLITIPVYEYKQLLAMRDRAHLEYDRAKTKSAERAIYRIITGRQPSRSTVLRDSIHLPKEVSDE